MKKLMMSAILMLPLTASAVKLNFTNVSCSLPGSGCTDISDALTDVINKEIPDVSLSTYATGISNANAFSYKGSGSDYSDKFTYATVRGSFGVAMAGDTSNPEGVGLGAAATIGVNLELLPIDKVGFLEFDKMDLFVSFMSYNIDHDVDDETSASGDLSSFGVFARYELVEGKDIFPGYMLEWGGVHLHTGFQRSSMKIELETSLDKQEGDAGGGLTAEFSDSTVNFELDSTVTSIPIEVSTYLRAAYVFTFFTGLGFDLNSGNTDIDLLATGSITGTGTAAGQYSSTLSANQSDEGDVDATNFRGFLGIQFNVPFVRVYAQVNKALGSDLLGGNLGLKVLW